MLRKTTIAFVLTLAVCLVASVPSLTAADSPDYDWFLVDSEAAADKPADSVERFLARQAAGLWELTLERPSTSDTRSGQVRVSASGSPLIHERDEAGTHILKWPKIAVGDQTWDISIEATVQQVGEELQFVFHVTNDAPAWIVREMRAPIVHDIDADRLDLLWPDSLGRRARDLAAIRAWRLLYPGWASMQWIALIDDDRGLYIGSHDDTFQTTALEADCNPQTRRFEASITKYPICKCGGSWQSEPIVVWSYQGTWHKAARRYRRWADETWFTDIERPKWVRETSGIELAILKQQNGEVLWSYPEIETLTKISQQSGLDTLGLFGWTGQGHDHLYPYYDAGEDLGGEAALRKGLAAARRAGRHPFLYADGHRIDVVTDYYRKHGDDVCLIDARGTHRMEYPLWRKYHNASPVATVNACMSSKPWQQVMIDVAIKAQELGASGILYDRIGGCEPYLCFSDQHDHAHPALATGPGKRALIRQVREQVKKNDPEFAVLTELVTDCLCQHVDLIHGHGMGTSNQGGSFPEMLRYTFPEMIVTQRHPSPLLNRGAAHFAVLHGLRHELEFRYAPDVRLMRDGVVPKYRDYIDVVNKPNIALLQREPRDAAQDYLRTLIAFERKHADLIWHGRFVDEEPFSFQGEGVRAKAFINDDKLGVVLWNTTSAERPVRVDVPGYRLVSVHAPATQGFDPSAGVPAGDIRLLRYVKK